jgi:hypothetical protein
MNEVKTCKQYLESPGSLGHVQPNLSLFGYAYREAENVLKEMKKNGMSITGIEGVDKGPSILVSGHSMFVRGKNGSLSSYSIPVGYSGLEEIKFAQLVNRASGGSLNSVEGQTIRVCFADNSPESMEMRSTVEIMARRERIPMVR